MSATVLVNDVIALPWDVGLLGRLLSMGYDDFEIMGVSAVDPTPDEEAWEAFLDFAHPILGGDDSLGLAAQEVADLERVVGASIPWEIGLFLVLGVPSSEGWHRWNGDPAERWQRWSDTLIGVVSDAVADGAWVSGWGDRPMDDAERAKVVRDGLAAAPVLLPLFEDCVVPLAKAEGVETDMANPILRVTAAGVEQVGVDLAEWLHTRFDVPLPMWPPSPTRRFAIWSALAP